MIRALALLLTLVTGFSGLVYEITWQKFLATLLGSHGEATAAVLAIFLGGLSVGYALFGRWTRSGARSGSSLLVAYGVVEASIGLYAFAFATLFGWARGISAAAPFASPPLAFGFDVALATVLIGPPAICMGATIPLLTQALARDLEDATGLHARVYAINTAGAFFGALAAGFWLVPALGLVGVLQLVGWLNVVAGLTFLALGALGGVRAGATIEAEVGRTQVEGFARYAAIAALIGFAMMTIQVVFIRLGGLSLGSSHFTFAMVVAVFVLCIALGSMAVSALARITPTLIVANLWILVAWLLVLYGPLGDGPYWAHALRTLFRDHPAGFHPFHANALVALLFVIGPPVMLSGAALPLLFHHLREQVGDLGALAGRLYSWNTVGSLVGALAGGYLLFYWLDLHAIYRVAIGALVAAATLASLRVLSGGSRARSRYVWASLAVPALVILAVLPAWAPERLASGTFRFRRPQSGTFEGADAYFREFDSIDVTYYDDDPAVSVAVVDHPLPTGGRSLAIVTNGKPDGSIGVDYTTMALASLLPAVLVDRISNAFVIGYGTGVTVGEMAALESVEEVVVAEISSGVIDAAPLFDSHNLFASQSPKVRIVRADAYRALQRSERRYDAIISEPSNPWVTGTEMLYSREFLEAARGRLAPGGIHVQWFHAYETDDATVALVLNTFREVFDDVAVWYASGPDYLILGFAEQRDRLEIGPVLSRARRPDIAAGLARTGIDSVPELLAHELMPLGVVDTLELDDSVHTLLHPILSDRAARAFFRGGQGELPRSAHSRAQRAAARTSLVAAFARRSGGRLTSRARARFAEETCAYRPRECAVVLARWFHDDPQSAERAALLARTRTRPGFGPGLTPYTQRSLSELFDASAELDGDIGSAEARAATDSFERFYHHSVPFERAALRARFEACARQPGQTAACAKQRAAAEARLGPLEPSEDGAPLG